MGRAPCCEKMGLKKGPWTPEEDRILIVHINKHGHPNWRALPKQAGLLRCGKSCRLRWINYLRPDIKRGNFSKEEEETIINLHDMLGNRWSAIAGRLPGRTDNEIKNVWHTHLKKKAAAVLKQNQKANTNNNNSNSDDHKQNSKATTAHDHQSAESAMSPQASSSSDELSSVTTGETNNNNNNNNSDQYCMDKHVKSDHEQNVDSFESFPVIDESFWTDTSLSENSSNLTSDFGGGLNEFAIGHHDYGGGMDFWYNILVTSGADSLTLPF
ncbi:hypothetical protein CICLE_v10005629mg [Citrus x clementina]|uniref:Uncharacterized protein n=1 Tax=Citrus clementina TaxID=85681 RepID=V4RZV9_CITCL|nr:transcription factor MYB13 [Citrus x clementina]ESR33467.1 hypothetical protein CICLE_v10005629mg [Citrus x clementina]